MWTHSLEVEEHAAGDEEGDEAEGVAAHVDDLGVVRVAARVHEGGVTFAGALTGPVVVCRCCDGAIRSPIKTGKFKVIFYSTHTLDSDERTSFEFLREYE